ncbi:SIR2 family protein [Kribbella sp. NPDC051770]|uniref:SIR2 family protein n=1 Tax=Kribbella sp. NPDC051770 TaxID=3155413 RepID=UPI003414132D
MIIGEHVVLLGAGSSVEAGLPTSVGLTRKITDIIGTSGVRETAHALNFAIGALVAHDTARGGSVYAGVDVERLFAAIRMLSDRDSLEIAPFVANWNPALEGISRQDPFGNAVSRLQQEFLKVHPNSFSMKTMFDRAVRDAIGGGRSDAVYRSLQIQMIDALRDCLELEGDTVDYLAPLLAIKETGDGPIRIASLNYDRSVELLCGRAGMEVTTGVSLWSGGYDWSWEAGADVRLLKLHGSIDWMLGSVSRGAMSDEGIHVGPRGDHTGLSNGRIGVVFGQREKLRSDGPFLAMLRELDEFLRAADHLTIVGYSFRDDHINAAVRRWFNSCADPHLTIIDPGLFKSQERSPFINSLRDAMLMPFDSDTGTQSLSPAHEILDVGAGEGLRQVFGSGPDLTSVVELRATLTED